MNFIVRIVIASVVAVVATVVVIRLLGYEPDPAVSAGVGGAVGAAVAFSTGGKKKPDTE